MNQTQAISDFKESAKKFLKDQEGEKGMPEMMLVLHEENGKYGHTLIEVNEFMKDDQSKDTLRPVLDMIFKKMHEEGQRPVATALITEAWLRSCDKDKGVPDDWKSLPKTEVLIAMIETEFSQDQFHVHVTRDSGNRMVLGEVGSHGSTAYGGRFSGLFSKYKDDNKN